MTTLNISLPDAMKAFVEAQVNTGQYASSSDYIRALVREDQRRKGEQELEEKLLAALDSQDFRTVTPELFERLRAHVQHTQTVSKSS
ncbi:MAG: type II toxin-antitoxin system ParD family antitoxin [Candidatus Tectomicrobia bacterium]|uniref:Type II toxin-antitoxin system ParD family antitoxin n=1 Tax=Tectimicrobiota bacterium TaxID=2528274 RepID=A0A937W015_UNCTE|nr:type II toxin-antitoxin system ParD family antitoxin [Candidatus Tectomicrobia bacterium]